MAGLFLWLMAAALHDPGSLPHGNRVQLLAQDQMSTSLAVMALEVHRRPELAKVRGLLGEDLAAILAAEEEIDGGVSREVSPLLGPQRVLFCVGECVGGNWLNPSFIAPRCSGNSRTRRTPSPFQAGSEGIQDIPRPLAG